MQQNLLLDRQLRDCEERLHSVQEEIKRVMKSNDRLRNASAPSEESAKPKGEAAEKIEKYGRLLEHLRCNQF